MDVRTKLVELLRNSPHLDVIKGYKGNDCTFEQGADWLIAHGVTVQEWIPASDPPKESGEYVVMIHGGVKATTLFYSEYYKVWCEFDDDEHEIPYNVTRWMPLPEPPKGE